MLYNVKKIEYLDSTHIRVYGRPVQLKNKISVDAKKTATAQHNKFFDAPRSKKQIEHSIHTSVSRTVNQIYSIARSNHWEYFVTLTIDPQKLDNTDFNLVSEKLNIWTNNIRKRYAPDLKYLIVPELHRDKEKWHFHGLFSNIGNLPMEFSGKVCVGKFIYDYVKKPYATKIYNLPLWKYGFSTATKVRDSSHASSYITKYITKDVSRILMNQHRYLSSQNIDRPIEKVYYVENDILQYALEQHFENVDYISNVKIPHANQQITYMEFNR